MPIIIPNETVLEKIKIKIINLVLLNKFFVDAIVVPTPNPFFLFFFLFFNFFFNFFFIFYYLLLLLLLILILIKILL